MNDAAREVVTAVARDFPEIPLVPEGMWIVGGAVRDALLGRSSPDVDLVGVDAEAKASSFAAASGGRFVPLGRERFPTWRVVVEGRTYDFTELAGETIGTDLTRRDFTINALAAPIAEGPLEDPFGGRDDLGARVVRMVSRRNLAEDPLRVLKAIRMAATLDFDLDPETRDVCGLLAPDLVRVAPERVAAELDIIFGARDLARAAGLLRATRIDEVIFGHAVPPALGRLDGGDPVVAWATLFRGAGPGVLRQAAADFRWPAALRSGVAALLHADGALAERMPPEELDVLLYDAGPEAAGRLARLRQAWGDAEGAALVRERLVARGPELFSTESLLTGDEIAEVGVLLPGPDVGRYKRELLVAQIRGDVKTREDAVAWLRARTEDADG